MCAHVTTCALAPTPDPVASLCCACAELAAETAVDGGRGLLCFGGSCVRPLSRTQSHKVRSFASYSQQNTSSRHTCVSLLFQDTRSAWPVLRAEGPIPPPLLSVHARSSLKLWASCRGCQHASATLPSGVLLCTHWYLRRPPLPPRSPGRTLPAVSPRGHCWRLRQVNLKQAHAYPLRNAVVLLKQPVCLTRAAF
jgi:hypothetical protein